MKILAIDPGNQQSAYVFLEDMKIVGKMIVPNEQMLRIVEAPIRECGASAAGFNALAIEMVESFGMAVGKEVFETVFWTGRFVQAWRAWNPSWARVYRKEVKMHLCKSMRAKDGNIRQALIDKLGPQGTKKAPGPTYGISKDVWSALAVGVTWLETRRSVNDGH